MTETPRTRRDSRNAASPESMTALLGLPARQRQLVVWMMRQGTVNFQAIVAEVGEPDIQVRSLLADLIQQGLVTSVGKDAYQAYSPSRRQQPLADSLLQNLTPSKPLAVILSSAGSDQIVAGQVFELGITVSNQGTQSAIIHVYINDMSPYLRPWCPESQGSLALAPGQSGEVVLSFNVPETALPGSFDYLVVVEAPDHYPELTPLQYPQQLQVSPQLQDRIQTADPTFAITPTSQAQTPLDISPGGTLDFQVQVFNRSERVDRFRLVCLDLPVSWYRLTYPQDIEGLGLLAASDSLALNPGDQGLISLTLMPPVAALADTYTPTLQLLSENKPDLALLDLIYLRVLPIHQLQSELITLARQVRNQPAQFQLLLINQGNSPRTVAIAVRDLEEPDFCTYTLDAEVVDLAPQQTRQVGFKAIPAPDRRRPLIGGGRLLTFQVDLTDVEALPLPNNWFQGYFTWLPRPWWHLLLALLGLLGVLGVLVWLVWWLFFKPPAVPQTLEFFVEDDRYAAAEGDRAHVGWQIRHPNQIQTLRLVGISPDGAVLSGPLTYDLSGDELPPNLAPFCTLEARLLNCRNVYTDARRPGEYIFELTVIPKGESAAALPPVQTDVVVIEPIPLPEVVELVPGQTQYAELGTPFDAENPQGVPPLTPEGIRLNWVLNAPENLQDLLLVVQQQDGTVLGGRRFSFRNPETGEFTIPEALNGRCTVAVQLVCRNVATGIRDVGDYTFELRPLALSEPELELEAKVTDAVKVIPRPIQLVSFQIDGQDAPLTKFMVQLDQQQGQNLLISWEVEGGSTAKVELLPSPGQVPLSGGVLFPLTLESGTATLTLQVTNGVDDPLVRSVTVETFDPTPTDPAVEAARATAAAAVAAAAAGQDGGGGAGEAGEPPPFGSPTPSDPGRLSPSETPPQFD
jgi:hypothetical protein